MKTPLGIALLALASAPAQTVVQYPCGPVQTWFMCGAPQTGGAGTVFAAQFGSTLTLDFYPSHTCGTANLVSLMGSHRPAVNWPIVDALTGLNRLGVDPVWTIPVPPMGFGTHRVLFNVPPGISGVALRYQFWNSWSEQGVGVHVAGSNCLSVVW